MRSTVKHGGILLFIMVVLSSCGRLSFITGSSPYEKYKNDLQKSGLSQTALARDWIAAGTAVFSDTNMQAKLPFKGIFYFNPAHPRAALSVFEAKRGQKITITTTRSAADSFIVFVDLFKAADTSRPVAFMQDGKDSLKYKVRQDGKFLLRLQPELLRGGKVIVNIILQPQLSFPVQGAANKNIQSFFGATRDGGARSHEGVDIFAPRGTPVLAPAPGRIISVRNNDLGGKVVSQWDTKRNITYYFAHLSEQIAHTGEAVAAGDTIGLVGNTGNAITTPPHLHFGIYTGGGAIDPLSFIYKTDTVPPALKIKEEQLGKWALYKKGGNNLPVKLTGGSSTNYFILSPDGNKIQTDRRYVDPVTKLRTLRLTQFTELKQTPDTAATAIATLEEGEQPDVLGSYHNFLLIKLDSATSGWIKEK